MGGGVGQIAPGVRACPLQTNLGALLERPAALYGPRTFVTQAESGVSLTFGEFNAYVNRIAHGLLDPGTGEGDYVAIMLSTGIEFPACSYALKQAGSIEVMHMDDVLSDS